MNGWMGLYLELFSILLHSDRLGILISPLKVAREEAFFLFLLLISVREDVFEVVTLEGIGRSIDRYIERERKKCNSVITQRFDCFFHLLLLLPLFPDIHYLRYPDVLSLKVRVSQASLLERAREELLSTKARPRFGSKTVF